MKSNNLAQQALDALNEYFEILKQTGYIKDETVNKLLVFLLIEEFLNTDISAYVTNEDYNAMQELLNIIYDNVCIIPYPEYIKEVSQQSTILATFGGLQPFLQSEVKTLGFSENGTTLHSEYKTEFWDDK